MERNRCAIYCSLSLSHPHTTYVSLVYRCGVSKMLYECDDQGFEVHYYPLSDCDLPSTTKLLQMLTEIKTSSKAVGRKVCFQSPNGVGKACMGMCNTH